MKNRKFVWPLSTFGTITVAWLLFWVAIGAYVGTHVGVTFHH